MLSKFQIIMLVKYAKELQYVLMGLAVQVEIFVFGDYLNSVKVRNRNY